MKFTPTFVLLFFQLLCNPFLLYGGIWTSLNGPTGYNNPQSIVYHQGAMYASSNTNGSTGTGVWKTINAGIFWTDVSSALPKPYAKAMEGMGAYLFAASDSGVYKTSDQGLTWTNADSTLPDFTFVIDLEKHQGELYATVFYGTGAIEIFKTSNNGDTWSSTGYVFSFSNTVNQLFSSGNTLWASTTGGVYKSTDGGVTFNYFGTNIPFNASINSIVAVGDTAYCGTSNGAYYTNNGGQLWNQITIPSLGGNIFAYSWRIIGNNVYAGINSNGIYQSPLGQSNWTVFGSGFYNNSFTWMMSDDGSSLYAATTEGIYSCPLSGGNWVLKSGNITRARTSVAWAENNLVLAGSGFYSGLKRTVNGGNSWNNTSLLNQQGLYKTAVKINDTLIMPSTYNMHTSADNGQTWNNPSVAPIPNYDIASYGNKLIAPSGNQVAYSSDLGQSWSIFSTGLPSNKTVYSVGVKGKSAYAGTGNSIHRMEFPGAPWTDFSQGISGTGLVSSILTIGTTLIANNTFGVFRRTEEDSLWRPVHAGGTFYDLLSCNGILFAASYDGVLFSDNLGKTFHPWNSGFPPYMGAIESLFTDGQSLYAGASEYSAWRRTIEPEITITNTIPSGICTGTAVQVSATINANLNPNNKFYLELSDRFGRFIDVVKLDSVSSSSSFVTLNGTLPDSLPTGTGYRLRIVSSSPYLLVSDNGTDLRIIQRPFIQLQPANQNACPGIGTGFYTGASGDSLSYQWQVDQNGTGNYSNLSNNATYQDVNSPLLQIVNPVPSMNGFRYRCQLSNSCLTLNSDFGTLTVNTINNSVTSQPADTVVCSGLPAGFALSANGTGLSYQWQVNSGFGVFTNISNNSQYAGANSSNLILNFTNVSQNGYMYRCRIGSCLYSDTATLTVNGEPLNNSFLPQLSYCDGGQVQFSVSVAGAGISYNWEEDNGSGFASVVNGGYYNGANSATLEISNIPASFNNYLYRCVITGLCSPFSSTTGNGQLLLEPPPAILTQPSDVNICEGDSAFFSAYGLGASLYYGWEMNTGTGWIPVPPLSPYSGVNTSTLKISQTDASMQNQLFRCRMNGCVTTDSASLNVLPLPLVSLSDLTVCINTLPYTLGSGTPAGGSYYGSYIYNGSFQPTAATTGIYFYEYIYSSPNSCSSSAAGFIDLNTCTGITEPMEPVFQFGLRPNPASEQVYVSFLNPLEAQGHIQLYTIQGNIVFTEQVVEGNDHAILNLSGLRDGLYLVRIIAGASSGSARLIVSH